MKNGLLGNNLLVNLLELFCNLNPDSSIIKLIMFLVIFNWVRFPLPKPNNSYIISPTTFFNGYLALTGLYLALFVGMLTDNGTDIFYID